MTDTEVQYHVLLLVVGRYKKGASIKQICQPFGIEGHQDKRMSVIRGRLGLMVVQGLLVYTTVAAKGKGGNGAGVWCLTQRTAAYRRRSPCR
jgi:hypothetical protein